jgi:voltage-gated sodium channel
LSRRERLRSIIEARPFQRTIIAIIALNAITHGTATFDGLPEQVLGFLHAVDRIALAIFVVEIAVRLYAYGWKFFRDPWSVFDALIVGIALVPVTGPTSVLRTLRILRALRLISAVPSMRRVVSALLSAIPGMASIIGLLLLVMYVSAVISTEMFGKVAPDYFADLPTSLFSLFQIMTGEAWPDIADQVMSEMPWAWIFFVGYILTSSYVVLNLFIAVVVNALDDETVSREEKRTEDKLDTILQELARLHARIDALERLPEEQRSGGHSPAQVSSS